MDQTNLAVYAIAFFLFVGCQQQFVIAGFRCEVFDHFYLGGRNTL